MTTFKDFLYLTEGSFTKKDVPPYFYVGIYFSKDLVERKPFTPPGAVCTLVGVEGISENSSTAFGMWHGAGLQMPGNAVVELNRVSRIMWENPHYIASAGFRTSRRTQSGSGDPFAPRERTSRTESLRTFIDNITSEIGYKFPDIYDSSSGSIKMQDGTKIKNSQLLDLLEKTKPHMGALASTKRLKRYGGKPQQINDPYYGRLDRRQRGEPIKDTEQTKSVRNAADLASRLMVILRGTYGHAGVSNPDRLLEPATPTTLPQDDDETYLIDLLTNLQKQKKYFIEAKELYNKMHDYLVQSETDDYLDDETETYKNKSELEKIEHFNSWLEELVHNNKITSIDDKGIKKYGIRTEVPFIITAAIEASRANRIPGHHSGEKEWILRREAIPKSQIVRCANCKKFFHIPPEQFNDPEIKFKCPKCTHDNTISRKNVQVAAKPLLHVPVGSTLYIQNGEAPPHFKHVINEYNNQHPDDPIPSSQEKKFLVKYYRLYDKFYVHLVDNHHNAQLLASHSPTTKRMFYDPDINDIKDKIKNLVERGIDKEHLLVKLLEKQGVPGTKVKNILARWRHMGMAHIDEGGKITLNKNIHNEDQLLIINYITNKGEAVTASEISTETAIPPDELEEILKELLVKDKLQKLTDGKYDIMLNEKEMKTISPLEQEILDLIASGRYESPLQMHPRIKTTDDIQQIKTAIRHLMLKHKIFRGPWSNFYRIQDTHRPLNPLESNILSYLQKWPISNKESIIHTSEDKNENKIIDAIETLMSREFVIIEKDNRNVKLNTDNIKAHPNAKHWPETYDKIIEILKTHYIGSYSDLIKLTNRPVSSIIDDIGKINENNWTKHDGGRYKTPGCEEAKNTIEGKEIITALNNVSHATAEELLNELRKINDHYQYSTLSSLIIELQEAGAIVQSYDPTKTEYFYHLSHKPYKAESAEYEKKLLAIVAKTKTPQTRHQLLELFQRQEDEENPLYLNDDGISYILKILQEQDKIKNASDVIENEVWYLPNQSPPKDLKWWESELVSILKDDGPLTYGDATTKLIKDFDLYYEASGYIIDQAIDNKIINKKISEFNGKTFILLPTQKMQDKEDYKKIIIKIIKEGPANIYQISQKCSENDHLISTSALNALLDELITKNIIKKTRVIGDNIYHLESQDPYESWYEKIKKYIENEPNYIIKAKKLYNLMNYANLFDVKNLLENMVNKGIIYKISQGDDYWMQTYFSLNADAKVLSPEEKLIKFMQEEQANGENTVTAYSIWELLKVDFEEESSDVRMFIEDLIENGKIFLVSQDEDNYDWWRTTTLSLIKPDINKLTQEATEKIITHLQTMHRHVDWGSAIVKITGNINFKEILKKLIDEGKLFRQIPMEDGPYNSYGLQPPPTEEQMSKDILAYMQHIPKSVPQNAMDDIYQGMADYNIFKQAFEKLVNSHHLIPIKQGDISAWWYEWEFQYNTGQAQPQVQPATPEPHPGI